MDKETLDNGLLTACRENNVEDALMYLSKKDTNPMFEKENWTPLLWAACNGNEELVKALINKSAHAMYLNNKDDEAKDSFGLGNDYDEQGFDPFVKPKDARKVGRYTPLHWASYKGFYKLVCKFLKLKMSPLEIDMYGNTAVH